jgi:hypothetical protein
MAWTGYYPNICLEGQRKTQEPTVKIVGVQAEIRTKHFSNSTCVEHYLYISSLG